MEKKITKYFWIGYILLLIATVTMCSCKVVPKPRYQDASYYYLKLEENGYIEVTVFNLMTGEHSVRIIKYKDYENN